MDPPHKAGREAERLDYADLNYKKKYFLIRRTLRKLITTLRETQQLLNTVLEDGGTAAFTIDAEGRFRFFNSEVARVTGYTAPEVLGKHFRMVLTLDDLSDGFRLFYQTMKGTPAVRSRFRLRRKDGSTIIAELDTFPVWKQGKVFLGLVVARPLAPGTQGTTQERERVERFKQLSEEMERWKGEVRELLEENNRLKNLMQKADGLRQEHPYGTP